MTPLLAIARREFLSFFRTPTGWVVCALYMLLSGVVFAFGALRPGEPATLRDFFTLSNWAMMFLCPAVSMRLFAEERRTGTIETLFTAPVGDGAVTLGKALGAFGFVLAMLAPTLVFPLVLASVASPDPAPIVAGYCGLALLGAFYLGVGALVSALTSSVVVAFLGALFALLLLRIAASQGAALVGPPFDGALASLSVEQRMADFGKGVLDTSHMVFFLGACAFCLVLSGVALGSRRWR